jgi:AcrR family transcriptional regulator
VSPAATAAKEPKADRAAAVRAALRTLVAERGFHGASMGAVAREAGVATGTAYVHYASKDELVIATYLESKQRVGRVAARAAESTSDPSELFPILWKGIYRHLAADPDEARFLIQVDGSPYAAVAHEAALAREDDDLMRIASAPAIARVLEPLPPEVLYEIGLAPAVRLAARGIELTARELDRVAAACWRAISRPA